jgi:hypothetical protein
LRRRLVENLSDPDIMIHEPHNVLFKVFSLVADGVHLSLGSCLPDPGWDAVRGAVGSRQKILHFSDYVESESLMRRNPTLTYT